MIVAKKDMQLHLSIETRGSSVGGKYHQGKQVPQENASEGRSTQADTSNPAGRRAGGQQGSSATEMGRLQLPMGLLH